MTARDVSHFLTDDSDLPENERQLLSRGRQLFVGRAGARHLRRCHHLVLVLPGLRALLVQWRELLRGELQQPRL